MKRPRPIGFGIAAAVVATTLALAGPASAATQTQLLPPTISSDETTFTIGTAAKFALGSPPDSIVPTRFVYQLNAGAPVSVAATNGHAVVSVVPSRFTNVLAVYSVSGDGAFSNTTTEYFDAAYPPPAADQDLTGDGRPDLLTVGGTPGLPSGLWMAAGTTGWGAVNVPPVNLGANGNGAFGDQSPADFDGAQVITGKFTGSSFEDTLVYYPSGRSAGFAVINPGNGNWGAPNPSYLSSSEYNLTAGTFSDWNGDNPIQLANAYDGSGSGNVYPDLIGIVGDPTNGYTLDYYQAYAGVADFAFPAALSVPTPTGGMDWQNWRISSKLLPTGTALALWNPSTGGLYLWEGVTFNADTGALSFTQYTLSANWQPAATPSTLQLTDVNADGVPDLWAVTPAGDVTAYVVSNLSASGPATLKAEPTQHLS